VSQQLYVSTDARGTQYFGEAEIRWSLPVRAPGGTFKPGEVVKGTHKTPLPLLSLDGLLEGGLAERIFIAEVEAGSGAAEASFGLEADAARLVAETAWSITAAARFALDCAGHVLGDRAAISLPGGPSLGEVLAAARGWLEQSENGDGGLLGRMARVATAHRLRKQGAELGDFAFAVTVLDQQRDLDVLDDPEWVAIAATRDAVLSAVEALRHEAFPHLVEDENVRYELDSESNDAPPEIVETPWGSFMAGRRSGVVPAWIAARDAAERARQAVADDAGAEAGAAERAWQRELLLTALG